MRWILILVCIVCPVALLAEEIGRLEALRMELKQAQLDPEACFRVRDFRYQRNEVRLYLTEGVLMFRKAVNGVRTGAVFIASEELEDAEILMIPPNRMERKSLASFTGSPNLDEHFRSAAFVFSDGTAERWIEELNRSGSARRSPERGVLIAESWGQVMRNLSDSLEPRLLEDLSNGGGPGKGFFFAAFSGRQLGNFDLYFDPRGREEVLVGQLENVEGKNRYNFWTHFEPGRSEPRQLPIPAAKIESWRRFTLSGDRQNALAVESGRPEGLADGFVASAASEKCPLEWRSRRGLSARRVAGQSAPQRRFGGTVVAAPSPLEEG